MKVLVIGANGNTGTRVVKHLAGGVHDPVAMIRDPTHRAKFDSLGVATVLADLEYPIDHAVQNCDAIIFAAGSGGSTGKDKTVLIDHKDREIQKQYRHRDSEVRQEVLFQVASDIGATPNQVILAWLTGHGIIPITGASTPQQMSESLAGFDLTLPDEILSRLDAAGAEQQ
ncbi:MAG: aldo/keto reductase [Pseudomonadales bacterium]|jgi:hypothetical protein|nr:aldo/keto reductase [Pseudomonadales bacterium]MDP7596987.1 aldo/keto reductase [Pseudomonadales bacterium]HJN50833.1 aldo/keto reductase [Pseudomonadales bacterium]|tara:strand:- start:935 stop:1447 length:513 start_codon:yes stop_codon:yes gene_type:complete